MKRWMTAILGLGLAFAMTGCDDDDDNGGGGGGGSAAGTWVGSGAYVHNSVPIRNFTLNINQNGNAISGTYSITRDARPTMSGSLSGSVNGGSIDLVMGGHGFANGTFGGNSMTLSWTESGFGGAAFTGPRNGTVALSR